MQSLDPDERSDAHQNWTAPANQDDAHDAEEWPDAPVFGEEGAPRRLGLLAWVAGGVILALIALALLWGITGIGRVEPTATPTATLVTVFRAAATSTPLAGAVITPTASLPVISTEAAPTPAPVVPAQIRVGGQVRIVNADPEGISVRYGPGQNNQIRTILHDGVELTVMEPPAGYTDPYPTTADGFTWWRIRMADGAIGWMASNWLQPIN